MAGGFHYGDGQVGEGHLEELHLLKTLRLHKALSCKSRKSACTTQ